MANSEAESPTNLLRIPQETRDNIYSFIGNVNDVRRLWVCRQLYNETRQLFFDKFALELDVFADCRRPLQGHQLVDGTPKQQNNIGWTLESPVRHGQYAGRTALRPLTKRRPRGVRLKSVHVHVSTIWRPSDPEATWCSFCRDNWCLKCGNGLYIRLLTCLRSKIDPRVVVKLYYHLDGELDLMSRPETRIPKKTRMLSIFKADGIFKKYSGLPQCKTLIICCSAGNRTSSEMGAPHSRNDLEWTSIYNELVQFMLNGSLLEHLEIWLPECIFRLSQTEASESRRRLNHGNNFLGFLRQHQENFGRPRVFYQQTILGLGSIKLMVWNDQERPSQQRVPVRALEAEELKKYLESEVEN
ncbi:MAG: hypothetical protein L6R42_004443 [Xanthoria sp. 1 TBL-2021]|nr:MAG: hypothetical protein L6R42_004443 [Xanthoria sp. 1 TBL-2021]